jgi:hypothetical protein
MPTTCKYLSPVSVKPCGGTLVQAFQTTKVYDRCTRCGHVTPAKGN